MISQEGKRIWVAGHRGMGGSALVRRLSGLPEVKILTLDIRDLDLTDRAATTAQARDGAGDRTFKRLDILVSNAGVQIVAPLAAFDFYKWKKFFHKGTFAADRLHVAVVGTSTPRHSA
ncbi:hypothetical protein GCM10010869_28710 [Mesorhizobium tianshanense]|uniref:Short subunit dehydrogenase n=1 Tax=Mesorhizobium tianshanense TaxID=39844 RepID=A0A562MPK8_9HYPH|nr:SDR family NAD(P)-dependent oxidoreductase [Mesorhizobium tianshanense]TWI21501.1 short subunit dehydrogenase [Mesorhizobium tianshanense]GLS37278.1 hypothetical protein GCM10010869_28710 [Mesorhizobium tianshanense]